MEVEMPVGAGRQLATREFEGGVMERSGMKWRAGRVVYQGEEKAAEVLWGV